MCTPVFALGLGEIRTTSRLGERLHVEIDLLQQVNERLDTGCIRLRNPRTEEGLPSLTQGAYGIRRGSPSVLTISSNAAVFDPVIQVGVFIGCGFEVQRDYTLFLSPRMAERAGEARPNTVSNPLAAARVAMEARVSARRRAVAPVASDVDRIPPAPRSKKRVSAPRSTAHSSAPEKKGDRLVLFSGPDGLEPSLAMSTSMGGWREDDSAEQNARRESLRVEYRMLQALQQQALSLLETAEKLRQLEQTLSELQQRTDELAKAGVVAQSPEVPPSVTATTVPAVQTAVTPVKVLPPAPTKSESKASLWFYSGLALLLAMVGGWLFWRQWRRSRGEPEFSRLPPELVVDPIRASELDTMDPLDREEHSSGVRGLAARTLDDEFEKTAPPPEAEATPEGAATELTGTHSSQFSVAAATVEEHFEVNPVMELADIMLSFGRVKGAAQALQEFVDDNPEEALQPWIRLMEVYRMGGMREEFERVAANLNQYFNIEVQNWDSAHPGTLIPRDTIEEASPLEEPLPIEWPSSHKKAKSLEDIPHICNRVAELWTGKDCAEYLNSLLRDNRGGLRSGFTLEVVDEILLLIEMQEAKAKEEASRPLLDTPLEFVKVAVKDSK